MSNRLWAKHVTPPSKWQRIPLILKIFLILALLFGSAYGAVQVIQRFNGGIRAIGTGLTVSVNTPAGFMNMNITNPMTQYVMLQQNVTWTMQNTGQIPLSVKYFTDLPLNVTLIMVTPGQVDFQGKTLAANASTQGWFNITAGHFTAADPLLFTLTIQGCYPVGKC